MNILQALLCLLSLTFASIPSDVLDRIEIRGSDPTGLAIANAIAEHVFPNLSAEQVLAPSTPFVLNDGSSFTWVAGTLFSMDTKFFSSSRKRMSRNLKVYLSNMSNGTVVYKLACQAKFKGHVDASKGTEVFQFQRGVIKVKKVNM